MVYSLIFVNFEVILIDEEINKVMDKVIKVLIEMFGVSIC